MASNQVSVYKTHGSVMNKLSLRAAAGALTLLTAFAQAQNYNLTINAALGRKSINPLIYGIAFGSQAQMQDLGATVNRMGGNNLSRYNWKVNALNIDANGFFETPADPSR